MRIITFAGEEPTIDRGAGVDVRDILRVLHRQLALLEQITETNVLVHAGTKIYSIVKENTYVEREQKRAEAPRDVGPLPEVPLPVHPEGPRREGGDHVGGAKEESPRGAGKRDSTS